ncbi:MAG: cyclic nucleotide-binding domain-containing protein, partial [Candidatus Promineifilaceae bacterium]
MRALEPTTVLEIPKTALYQLMQFSAEFDQTMRSLYSERAVWTHMRSAPMFELLDDASLRQLLDAAQLRTMHEGELLFAEGDDAQSLYLVRTGFLKVRQGKRVLIYFREGDAFGALSVLTKAPQAYTVSANTRSEIIEIPRRALTSILRRQPQLRYELIMKAQAAEKMTVGKQANKSAKSGGAQAMNATMLALSMTGLLEQGVMQGRQVLVIDQNICTDCNNCVESCGRRHGHPRLARSGLQMGNLLFPTACRHCEDPKCLLCSVSGIIREPDGQISIVPDNCIGCGACAERCPYDNIQMHAKTPPKRAPWHVDLLNMLLNRQQETPEPAPDEPLVAVKCDLCAGHSDYACVTACPVGAAFRVDPRDVFALSNNNIIGLDQISVAA